MRYRYLIWHFDGALFNTLGALRRATGNALAVFGIIPPTADLDALLAKADGAAARATAQAYGLPEGAFTAEWDAQYRSILLRDQPPSPGVVAFCRQVAEAGGHHYLYAARRHQDVARFLAAFGMTPLFTGWLTADAGELETPNFQLLLSGCGLPPGEVLLVSNRPADIRAAQSAGIAACFFGPNPPAGARLVALRGETLAQHVFGPAEVVS